VHADAALAARYAEVADELRFFFITSDFTLAPLAPRTDEAMKVEVEGADALFSATFSNAAIFVRCWHRRDDVGCHASHPELCGRFVSYVVGRAPPAAPAIHKTWFRTSDDPRRALRRC
jgi:isoleucyl-tRNA synthetase